MKLSPEQLASGKLNEETLAEAVMQLNLNGFVVFEKAIPDDLVDAMNERFLQILEKNLKENPEATELNMHTFRTNRIRMDLPFEAPFIDPRVINSDFVVPIVQQILGEDCRSFYLSVDAPMKGSQYQAVHGDYFPFFPESTQTMPPVSLVFNVALVDVTEENGPMDAWPGTHRSPEYMFKELGALEAAAKHIQPTKMIMPKGSIILRDVRMWHRGTPSYSEQIRPNLAIIYARSWYDGGGYAQNTLNITREVYEALPERAKKLYRFEKLVEQETASV